VARGIAVVASIRDTSLTLDGFTIQNCVAGPQTTVPGRLTAFGGGIFIDMGGKQTNPTNIIRNVTFRNDVAQGGDNTITDANSGTDTDFGEGVGGGLAAIFANDVVLENVTLRQQPGGSAATARGAAARGSAAPSTGAKARTTAAATSRSPTTRRSRAARPRAIP